MSTYTGSTEYSYTPQPEAGELVSQMIGLSGIAIVSTLFGIKTYNIQYRYLSYSKWLVILLYIFSWAFTFSGLHLVFTNNGNYISCLLSILACDVFYSGTKIIIYCWLIEKVWVVNAGRVGRWQCKSYRYHMLLLTPYIGIFVIMILFHNAWLEPDGTCIIGLQLVATVPLLLYDFIINLYMTILFVRPLFKIDKTTQMDQQASRLKEVAKRTMVASVVCLIVSFANVAALTILNGIERGLVCLTCCYMDVMINVVTVHFVTTQGVTKTVEYPNNKSNHDQGTILTSDHSQIQSTSSNEKNNSNSSKSKLKYGNYNEQFGRFGDPATITNSPWPSYLHDNEYNNEYAPTHYLSAMNNKIITSPAHPEYSNHSNNDPPHHSNHPSTSLKTTMQEKHSSISEKINPLSFRDYTHEKFIIVTTKDDDDFHSRSRSSSIQESYSSKQSLTKTNIN
ncbi:unnamed protein product [Cunninghamella blakesleeana]